MTVELAVALDGETEQLAAVLSDLTDSGRLRAYADWLASQGDARGEFLAAVVDDWESGAKEIRDDDSLSQTWRNTSGVTLLQGLRAGGLDQVAAEVRKVARPALLIEPEVADEELPAGSSKFGGLPDLPPGIEWPEYEEKIHTFIGQINLAELCGTQAGRELPSTGMLSFFVFDDPIETGQPAAEGAAGAWQVFYFKDTSQLTHREPPKEFDEGNQLAEECSLQFVETLDLPYVSVYDLDSSYADQMIGCRRARQLGLTRELGDAYEAILESLLPERETRSHLLGWSHPQVLADDPVDDGWRHLLTVASEEALDWCWADEHQLFYSVRPEDLAASRFDPSRITDG